MLPVRRKSKDIEIRPAKASNAVALVTAEWSFPAVNTSLGMSGTYSSYFTSVENPLLSAKYPTYRKHTGERPFACHCGKQFSRLDNLRQHAQTVHSDKPEQNEKMMKELTTLHTSLSTSNTRVHTRASGSTAERRRGAPQANDHSFLAQRPGTSAGYEAPGPGQHTDFRESFRTNDFRDGRADQFRDTRSSRTAMGGFSNAHILDQQQHHHRQAAVPNGDGRHSFLDSTTSTTFSSQSFLSNNQRDTGSRGQQQQQQSFPSSSITPSRSGLSASGSLGRPSANIHQSPGPQLSQHNQLQQLPERRPSPNLRYPPSVEHSPNSRPGTGVGLPPISEIVSPAINHRFGARPPSQSGIPSASSSSHQHNPFFFTSSARPGRQTLSSLLLSIFDLTCQLSIVTFVF